jgi:hypothetical protein
VALVFLDSFDGYATAQLTQGRWNSVFAVNTAAPPFLSAGTGRYGTQSLRINYQASYPNIIYLRKTLQAAQTWHVGWAFATASMHAKDILALREGGTTQVDVAMREDGTLEVTRNGTVLGTTSTGATTITASTYFYLELRAVIHSSTGSVQLRVNGQTLLSVSGVNTQATSNAFASELQLGTSRVGVNWTGVPLPADYDDLYVLDGTGPAPHNALLGDCRVVCLVPIGQELAEFTPSAGTNWDAVNEIPPSSTDYNEAQAVGSRDRFQYAALPALVNPVLYGVQMSLYCTNPDTGPRMIAAHAISGTQEIDGVGQALPGAYNYLQDRFARDPQGALWTPASLAAGRFGYKIVA